MPFKNILCFYSNSFPSVLSPTSDNQIHTSSYSLQAKATGHAWAWSLFQPQLFHAIRTTVVMQGPSLHSADTNSQGSSPYGRSLADGRQGTGVNVSSFFPSGKKIQIRFTKVLRRKIVQSSWRWTTWLCILFCFVLSGFVFLYVMAKFISFLITEDKLFKICSLKHTHSQKANDT